MRLYWDFILATLMLFGITLSPTMSHCTSLMCSLLSIFNWSSNDLPEFTASFNLEDAWFAESSKPNHPLIESDVSPDDWSLLYLKYSLFSLICFWSLIYFTSYTFPRSFLITSAVRSLSNFVEYFDRAWIASSIGMWRKCSVAACFINPSINSSLNW